MENVCDGVPPPLFHCVVPASKRAMAARWCLGVQAARLNARPPRDLVMAPELRGYNSMQAVDR